MPDVEIIAYKHGYWGLLSGEKIVVDDEVRANAHVLHNYGGSPPIGNSRVKLTNTADLVARGLIQEGENALEVAASKLKEDGVDVLHTIGGDDTNTTAADLAKYLHDNSYDLQVVGLPKTIDNDIVPIRQSLGARTAAEQTSIFAQNIIAEHGSNPRMLIIHEIMGRACGYLTAQAAEYYQQWHAQQTWLPSIGHKAERWDVHAVFLPELALDIDAEAERLKKVMDETGCVNIFLSEGAGIPRDHRRDAGPRRGAGEGSLRPRQDRQDQPPRPVVRQAVLREARRREGHGPEVRLLLAVREGERRRPAPDQVDDRPGRPGRPGGRLRPHRS